MWKASRVTSGGVRALRRPLLPCQGGRLSVTGGAQVPSVGPRFRNGAVAHPSRGFYLERPARSVPGRVVQAVDGVRSVQQWARP
ncbi:hypothetical protein V6Z77_010215 [Aspergillus fumigatus]